MQASLGNCMVATPGWGTRVPSQTPVPWRAACAKWDHDDDEENTEGITSNDVEMGQGVVDTGCTKMMVGARTMAKWLSHLEKKYCLTALVVPANTVFRFGGGSRKRAQWAVILPAGIGGRSCALKIYVVPGDAPLLLSRGLLKFLQAVVDVDRDILKIRAWDMRLPL